MATDRSGTELPPASTTGPDPKDQRKDVSRAGAAGFGVVFLVWLISVAFVAAPIAWLVSEWQSGGTGELGSLFYAVLAVQVIPWTILGPLFLTPLADRLWWQSKNGCRKPDRAEWARLEPLWGDVCARSGLHPRAYRLNMSDRSTINALASGDGVVSLDQGLLGMDDPEITAVLAHELGHHKKRHIGGIVLAWWYALPAQFVLRLALGIMTAVLAVGRGIFGCFGFLLVVAILGVMLLPVAALFLLLGGSTVLLRVLGRSTEYEADSYAVELGLGREMAEALRYLQAQDLEEVPGRWSIDRLMSTHPPLADRIVRLERSDRPALG